MKIEHDYMKVISRLHNGQVMERAFFDFNEAYNYAVKHGFTYEQPPVGAPRKEGVVYVQFSACQEAEEYPASYTVEEALYDWFAHDVQSVDVIYGDEALV